LSRVEILVPGTEVALPSGVRFLREVEARKARRRLYPVSVLYTLFAVSMLWAGLRSRHPVMAVLFFSTGVGVWTLVEYLVHRYILHGRFPAGSTWFEGFLHKCFDHLHAAHHERPWDGNHINGTIVDTLPFTGPLALVSFLLPLWSAPALLAGLLQAYIAEEWIHHSVHFCHFKSFYFQYIKRHHLYHHSPKGGDIAFGLTNGFWDVVYDTRIQPEVRRALYAPLRQSP
jgi:4-hydroxysphinganine ceramide fatty acyl 2-hydroxylase